MWQVDKLCAVARGEIGTGEQGDNRQKYGEAYGWNGVPWCVQFVWWCFRESGLSVLFYGGKKTASCGELLSWARQRGQTVAPAQVQRGDVPFLNFSGGGEPEHLGIAISGRSGSTIITVEGNTSAGGSQSNGDCVMQKSRSLSQIAAVWRPNYASITDYAGRWSEEYIKAVIRSGLMQGDPDGSFRPRDPVTREELAAVLARLQGGV